MFVCDLTNSKINLHKRAEMFLNSI